MIILPRTYATVPKQSFLYAKKVILFKIGLFNSFHLFLNLVPFAPKEE